MPKVRTAFRVTALPPTTNLEQVNQYLNHGARNQVDLIARSIACLHDGLHNEEKIATVYFNYRDRDKTDKLPELYAREGCGITVDTDFYGFTPLQTPQKPVADIIAVTGLAGNAFGSWASDEEHMWLRDSLTKDVPNARILIYGYDSKLKDSLSEAGLYTFATTFLRDLEVIRKHHPDRPLILIGHSLGGIVIAEALLSLHNQAKCPPIPLMIFLGTPHSGMETDALQRAVGTTPVAGLIGQLRMDSPGLSKTKDEFRNFASSRPDMVILTVYETCHTGTSRITEDNTWERDGPPIMMVPKRSAELGLGKQEIPLPSYTDHSQLAKLVGRTQGIYPKMRDEINKAIRSTGIGYEELIEAISDGDMEKAKRLITSGEVNLERHSENGRLPIVLAAAQGSKDVVELILRNVNPNARDGDGWTPLTRAISQLKPSIEVVELLLDRGANIDLVGRNQGTALHYAAAGGSQAHTRILEILLTRGENERLEERDGSKLTPLYLAARQHHSANVRLLIQAGADVNSKNWPDDDRKFGETPLMGAAYVQADSDVMEQLVAKKSDVKARTRTGQTALMIASENGYKMGVTILQENHADPSMDTTTGVTALMYAACNGHVGILRLLVEKFNANTSSRCHKGKTALEWAIWKGNLGATEYLLEKGDLRDLPQRAVFEHDVDRNTQDGIIDRLKTAQTGRNGNIWRNLARGRANK